MINIQLNGAPHALDGAVSVAALLKSIGIAPLKVAVERNLEIVPKSMFERTLLDDGDRIEIVQFVGGG